MLSLARAYLRRTNLLFLSPNQVQSENRNPGLDSMMSGGRLWKGTPDERLAEIGALLAAALQRLRNRQSSQILPSTGESSLHFSPDQSGGVPPYPPETSHD